MPRAAQRPAPQRAAQRSAPQHEAAPRQATPRPAPAAVIQVALTRAPVEVPRAAPGSAATCNLSFPCTDEGGRYYVGFDREKVYLSPRPEAAEAPLRSAELSTSR